MARLHAAQRHGLEVLSNPIVLAQVRRERYGRQASLARLLPTVDVRWVSPADCRAAGPCRAEARASAGHRLVIITC
jgi:hypothetical protein